jgi:hypothetical protein
MNTQPFRPLYAQLTPEERVQLVLAAVARRDMDEVVRLRDSCPRMKVVTSDPQYTELLQGMWLAGAGILYQWLDVSHRVVRTSLAASILNQLVLRTTLVRAPGHTKQLKMVVRRERAVLVSAKAECKKWSATWKGIEAAITRFCAERGFTIMQLFAMAKSLPYAIEQARADLDADVPANPEEEEAVYQALCHAWPGQNARSRG